MSSSNTILTHLNSSQFNYELIIRNFSFSAPPDEEQTPKFCIDDEKKLEGYLKIYIGMDEKHQPNDYVSIYLFVKSSYEEPLKSICKFKLINRFGDVMFIGNTMPTFEKSDDFVKTGLSNYISMKELSDRKFYLLPNETLTLHLTINVENPVARVYQCYLQKPENGNNTTGKFAEFNALFKDVINTDFSLVSGDSKIRAHKQVFEMNKVFNNFFLMKDINEVDVVDVGFVVKPKTLLEFKRFMYIDQVQNLDEIAEDILPLVKKYKLTKLKSICEDHLVTKLNIDNACRYFTLADNYCLEKLKNEAANCMVLHYSYVSETRDFHELIKPDERLKKELDDILEDYYLPATLV